MYSNKQNINILTTLLREHGIVDAVVCPGSRNAPIIHNLSQAGLKLHPLTDERCAAFYAMGLAQATGRPVAVCVTSGTAVLNLLPGIAEAAYQHIPVVAITADRPVERIGQLDGQTIEQPSSLRPYAAIAADVPEPHDRDTHILCNRLINEALITAARYPSSPVHINMRLSEPLMGADMPRLPKERIIRQLLPTLADPQRAAEAILARMARALRPMAVVGQMPPSAALTDSMSALSRKVPVLYEPLSSLSGGVPFDRVLEQYANLPSLKPDFVLYAGGTLVSKRLKQFIQDVPCCQTWAISADATVHDTFRNQTGLIAGDARQIMPLVAQGAVNASDSEYRDSWRSLLHEASAEDVCGAIPAFEHKLRSSSHQVAAVYYGNSSAVRQAVRSARHYVYCNRGINGIEGTLSTAAGHSLATDERVYCVLGDLSFFYDSNALWNADLRGNLRILLINDGHGSIFDTLPGMPDDAAELRAIMGHHQATARGICDSYGIAYLGATDTAVDTAMDRLIDTPSDRPVLLEITCQNVISNMA